ncbi:MAG TPA: hypothetical protein PK801_09350 [Aggregatilineales bacterium]|nr:hypothetical protein [Chloroflexota bacterium]HPV08696.1 hypothetical protein [Aggregatilineales bacterium]HQA68517.1 hypothetical protein [Aggregatilineales bacterium]HQE19866.1 hypothetical protein [Aggregatilineales bacterium]
MIDGMVSWLGPLLIIGGAVLLAAFTLAVRRGFEPSLRPIDGYKALPQQVARVVESGGRMHVSLGPNGLSGQDAGATLAGLAMLDVTVGAAAIADHPPLASTSDATTVWVMSDIVRHAYEEKGIADRLPAQNGFLVALDSTALAGGLTSLVPDMDVQANVLFGSFGAETALIAEAGSRVGIPQTVGSDQLEAQAAGYTLADHVLIGEEMFAARGYLEERASAQGGLLVQDVLRWAIIGLIVAGAALQTLGLLG